MLKVLLSMLVLCAVAEPAPVDPETPESTNASFPNADADDFHFGESMKDEGAALFDMWVSKMKTAKMNATSTEE